MSGKDSMCIFKGFSTAFAFLFHVLLFNNIVNIYLWLLIALFLDEEYADFHLNGFHLFIFFNIRTAICLSHL